MEIAMSNHKLRYICFLICLFLLSPAPALPDCHYKKGDISPADIKEVFFEVAGKFLDQEKKEFNKDQIKKNIVTKLKKEGVTARIVETKKQIKTNTFIKVRIHSIMLERQVYLCSAEIIQRQPSKKDCTVLKHSNVTSLVKYTPSLFNDLIDQLLRDIQ
jgi:RNA-binding protein YhbY